MCRRCFIPEKWLPSQETPKFLTSHTGLKYNGLMNILAVLGSARRGGNTETLIREALRGAGLGEDAVVRVLSEMNVVDCQGCGGCRISGSDGCIFEDDMQDMYREMKEADAIILGSPIYYGELTGRMKSFMDRWYALRDGRRVLRISKGKKVIFIITQGAEEEGRYADVVRRVEKVLTSYEMKPVVIVAPGIEKKGAVKEKPELLKRAFEAGESIALKA